MRIQKGKQYFENWRRSHGIISRAEYVESVKKPGFCSDCKMMKPLADFNKNARRPNGIQHICKGCQKRRYRDWQKQISPTHKEIIRQRNNAATKKYRRDPANRIKMAAHQMVAAALVCGILKAKPCQTCGTQIADAHHEDYTDPLNVIWLCRRHHKELHNAKAVENLLVSSAQPAPNS